MQVTEDDIAQETILADAFGWRIPTCTYEHRSLMNEDDILCFEGAHEKVMNNDETNHHEQ